MASTPTLYEAFLDALRCKAQLFGTPAAGSADATDEARATAEALRFVEEHAAEVQKALRMFAPDGKLLSGKPMPASAFNDFYKWTMCPVTFATHKSQKGGVHCSFSVNIRDRAYRKALHDSATGAASGDLVASVQRELESLRHRPFDRELFEAVVRDRQLVGWTPELVDYVCGPAGAPRTLADEVAPFDPAVRSPSLPKGDEVLVQAFVANDSKLEQERLYVEATGPWPRVTWLETTLMQVVYEALFREANRKRYLEGDDRWYAKWLAEAFVRTVRSSAAAVSCGMKGALFTGRRTGGMALMMIQAMYIKKHFVGEDGATRCLGTSSVTSHYWLKNAGVPDTLILDPAGTHAHELSMSLSAVFGELDDRVGAPLSQLVGHMAYFFLSMPNGDVRKEGRKNLMPMLPDTLGTFAFMRVASRLTVPFGAHKGQGVLEVIGAARQDSGTLADFAALMHSFGGALMASEIETPADLQTAARLGYKLFGAGGFMGDSEKAWDGGGHTNRSNISMAVKVLRVYINGERSDFAPVKTGDDPTGGKFEADGLLDAPALKRARARTETLKKAEIRVSGEELQRLFEEALAQIVGKTISSAL